MRQLFRSAPLASAMRTSAAAEPAREAAQPMRPGRVAVPTGTIQATTIEATTTSLVERGTRVDAAARMLLDANADRQRARSTRARRAEPVPCAGRALFLLLCALGLIVVGLLVWSGRERDEPAVRAFGPEHFAVSPSAQGGHMRNSPADGFEPIDEARMELPASDALPVEAIYGFDGKGSIRGEIHVPEGSTFPSSYRVLVEPSRVLAGRRHAVTREEMYEAGERSFELRGLPLGGYDLRVEAPGMNADRLPVLLCEGAEDPFVNVVLRPTGFIDGTVVDEAGAPAEDLLVTLEPLVEGARRETRTGPSGAYLFEDVPDGEYRMLLGPPHAPLAAPRELSFRAPSMNFPVQRIPALASFEIRAFDEAWVPLADARVNGYGSNGGQFELVTDVAGVATARYLPPGNYRISARHDNGLRAKLAIDVSLELPEFVQLQLRR